MRLRWRNVSLYILGGLLLWVGLFAWNRRHIHTFQVEMLRNSLLHHARLMEVMFDLSRRSTQEHIRSIGRKFPYRITLVAPSGAILADSVFPPERLEELGNQLNQPEIQEASRRGWGSDVRFFQPTQGWFLFAAVPLSTGGYVRLATPVSGPDSG